MADALQEIPTAGSLTSLAEEVRRTLEAARKEQEVGAVVFLRRANECAVVYGGRVQAVRVRSAEVAVIAGTNEQTNETGTLLDLLEATPAAGSYPVTAHYDTLLAGDVWLLAGARLFDARQLSMLPALLAERVDDTTLTAIQRLYGQGPGFDGETLPLMLLS